MLEALDVEPGGEQYLPFAQNLLRRLKMTLNGIGLNFGRRHILTPDGSGTIIVRTRRGRPREGVEVAFSQDIHPDSWYDSIQISGVPGGFVVQPAITDPGLDLEARYALIKYSSGKISMFPYTDMSRYPQNRSQIVTAGAVASGAGAFQGTKFEAFGYPLNRFEFVGAFLHTYTPAGSTSPLTRLLAVHRYGAIYDSTTGVALTTGGDAVAGTTTDPLGMVDAVHFEADSKGQQIVMNFYSATNRFAVTVDYGAAAQSVATRIVDTTPYGYRTTVSTSSPGPDGSANNMGPYSLSSSVNSSVSYPVSRGVATNGESKTIFADTVQTEGSNSSGVALLGFVHPFPATCFGSSLSSAANMVTIRLPNGNSKVFDTSRISASSTWSVDRVFGEWFEGSASAVSTASSGTLAILYTDPAVPVVVYHYTRTLVVQSDTASGVVVPFETGVYGILGTRARTTTTSLEVGILIGTMQRVLSTETMTTQTSVPVYVGTPLVVPAAQSSTVITPLTSNPYAKPLRNITRVNAGDTTSTRYSVSIRSAVDWLVSVSKLRDISNNPAKSFAIYAGRLNEVNLRQAFLDYLVAHASDPAVAAGIAAGNLSDYNIRLHLDSDLYTVASYV